MDASEVRELLKSGQSTVIAFASEKSSDLALAEMLSALANANGGTALLGLTHAGSVRGVREVDTLCDRVLSAALSITPPLILPMPEQVAVGDRTLVAVQVPRGLPHVYVVNGRYLVREGPRNRPLEPVEIHSLMMRRGILRFETQAPPGAALDDLDWTLARQYANSLLQRFRQSEPHEILKKRVCLTEENGDLKPTYAGLLLFGQDTSRWLTNAEILAVRYAGDQMGDQFVREDISGPLPDQIRRAEAFLRANTPQQVALEGLIREEQLAYPGDVLREVVVNAVAHRDYTIQGDSIRILVFSDRIQIYSPGRLPGHITIENMVHERFSRNPVIVQVLSDMGFIERLGYGIDRMLHLLQQAGHPAPQFEETAAGFQVTLYAKATPASVRRVRWAELNLNPRQEAAVQYVIDHQRITNREYQALSTEVSAETIRRDLSDLVDKDVLLRIGSKRATYYILKDASLANLADVK